MEEIKYNKDHYWFIIDNDIATIGITEYILDNIDEEIMFVELPEIGDIFNQSDVVGVIGYGDDELEIDSPLSGEIAEINETIIDEPATIQHSSFRDNWLFKVYIAEESELEGLMSKEEYMDYLDEIS